MSHLQNQKIVNTDVMLVFTIIYLLTVLSMAITHAKSKTGFFHSENPVVASACNNAKTPTGHDPACR